MEWIGFLQSVGLVVLGFSLGEGARYVREKLEQSEARRQVLQELEANRQMIPQRVDSLKKMQEAARRQEILPSAAVEFMTSAYERGAAAIAHKFSAVERDNLHVLHQYFKRTDAFMETYHETVLNIMRGGTNDPFAGAAGLLGDFIAQLERAEQMIGDFLVGKPRDVFYRKTPMPKRGEFL